MGQLATGSLVRLFGGTVGHCVGQLFCGQLEDWLVRFLVGVCWPFVQITICLFGRSIVWLRLAHGRSVGQTVAWAVDGLVEWLIALLVCRSVGCLLC